METGMFFGRIPYARVGADPRPIVVLGGGQAFVQGPGPERLARDARRVARILPPGASFVLLGYDVAPPPDHSLERIVADVAGILSELGGGVPMVGISYGGIVALRVAATHPELVERVVLLVSAHDFSAAGRQRVLSQIELAERRDLVGLLAIFAKVFRRRWLNWLQARRLRTARRRIEQELNEPELIVRGLRAVTDADLADVNLLTRVTAPCLLVGGSADQFFGDGRMQETAAQLPSATLALFPDETHMLPVERARDVAAVIAAFL